MKIIPLTKGFICLVDDCDYERLSEHSWSLMDTSIAAILIAFMYAFIAMYCMVEELWKDMKKRNGDD